jgi:hypothetical protein
MRSLPQTLTVKDEQGGYPIHFGFTHSRDLEDDRKAAALSKATEVRRQTEIGVTFDYLSSEVRWEFYWAKRILEARFSEKLYFTGFGAGLMTARIAAELTRWDYQVCLRALKGLAEFLPEDLLNMHSGELLSEFLQLEEYCNRKKNNSNSRGRKAQKFYIPSAEDINAKLDTATHFAFDMVVLESNKLYCGAIYKQKYTEKSVNLKLGEEAERLGISRPTLNAWLDAVNVDHSMPWNNERPLTPEEQAGMAEDDRELTIRLKQRKQRYGTVKCKETGERRPAHKNAVLGRIPDRAHFHRTGEMKNLPPLEGHLVKDVRIGTVVTDMGGFVHQTKKVIYPKKKAMIIHGHEIVPSPTPASEESPVPSEPLVEQSPVTVDQAGNMVVDFRRTYGARYSNRHSKPYDPTPIRLEDF